MAKHKPVLQIRLSVGRIRNLLHCAHPGLLMVLVTVSAVLLWQTFVIHRPTIPLGILVLAQIVAFGCTYRFPIPSLIVFAVLSMAGDAFSPCIAHMPYTVCSSQSVYGHISPMTQHRPALHYYFRHINLYGQRTQTLRRLH